MASRQKFYATGLTVWTLTATGPRCHLENVALAFFGCASHGISEDFVERKMVWLDVGDEFRNWLVTAA
jgi:hypothetical protein